MVAKSYMQNLPAVVACTKIQELANIILLGEFKVKLHKHKTAGLYHILESNTWCDQAFQTNVTSRDYPEAIRK